jgi:hypothetical protein
MLEQNYPGLAEFRAAVVARVGQIEVIRQSLYDTIVYPTAGLINMQFFQNPIGQGFSASPGNAGNVKTLADTNMTNQGVLPAPQAFFVTSIEVDFQAGSSAATVNTFALQTAASSAAAPAAATGIVQVPAVNDLSAFYSTGSLTLTIGTKPYLQEAPLLRFPPKARFELNAAVATNSATTAEVGFAKLKAGGRPYNLDPGLGIMTSMNFNVTLAWPVLVATPSALNGAVRVILDGYLFRAVQ